jgi:ketosteroid isomerase-like protein
MSENVEIVVRALRCFGVQDLDGMLADAHPEVEIDYSASDAPDAGIYRGLAGCRAFAQGRYVDFDERSLDVLELIDAPPDSVVAVGRMRGRGRASGAAVKADSFTLWTLRDRKIRRITLCRSRTDALEAARALTRAPTAHP